MIDNRVFVLGGTGYIGKEVVRSLIQEGFEVSLLARNPHKAETQFPKVNIIAGDLLEPHAWLTYLDQHAIIINLAFPHHGNSWSEGVRIEQELITQLIQHLQHKKVKLILTNGTAFCYVSFTE